MNYLWKWNNKMLIIYTYFKISMLEIFFFRKKDISHNQRWSSSHFQPIRTKDCFVSYNQIPGNLWNWIRVHLTIPQLSHFTGPNIFFNKSPWVLWNHVYSASCACLFLTVLLFYFSNYNSIGCVIEQQ